MFILREKYKNKNYIKYIYIYKWIIILLVINVINNLKKNGF